MKNNNIVVSLDAKRKEVNEARAKADEVKKDANTKDLTPEEIAEGLIDDLQEEIERQKENSEILTETLDDLFDDAESVYDMLGFCGVLSVYAAGALEALFDGLKDDEEEVVKIIDCVNVINKASSELTNKLNKFIEEKNESAR